MNDIGTINLLSEEAALLEQIDFESMRHDDLRRSIVAAGHLTPMLVARKAFPERRTRYFFDPDWGTRGKSRREVFESNGTVGVEIFSHGNFLKYLRFFIHGAALPLRVKDAMREQVGDPGYFDGEDLDDLRKLARKLARENSLDTRHDEDFVRLCADLGLSASHADSIGKAIRTIKPR